MRVVIALLTAILVVLSVQTYFMYNSSLYIRSTANDVRDVTEDIDNIETIILNTSNKLSY